MFILSLLRDSLRVNPNLVPRQNIHIRNNNPIAYPNLTSAIIKSLNERFSNKVIKLIGLAITVYDIQKIGEFHVIPGDGGFFVRVEFRLVVFRPFIGEFLHGVVKNSSRAGVSVSLEFFADIIIPASRLKRKDQMEFNEARQEWVWHSPVGPGEIYNSASIRFEVVEEHFGDPSPTPTHAPTPTGGQPGAAATGTRVGATAAEEAGPTGPVQADILTNATCIPYYLECSIEREGLGLTDWYAGEVEGDGEATGDAPENEFEGLATPDADANAVYQ